MADISLNKLDAFSQCIFYGNSAAICSLDALIAAAVLQSFAANNNLSEAAFSFRPRSASETDKRTR